MRSIKYAGVIGFAATLVVFMAAAGCAKPSAKKLGMAVPADAPIVKLADVLAAPQEYNGKKIVIKGTVRGQCASLCEFFLHDGIHTATIFPQGYKFPKLSVGTPVVAYVLVTSGAENVVFSALGLTME